jgi:flagellar basal-body rod protein FlgC
MQAIEISRTALDVEWRRLELIAQNLANINSARTEKGTLYQAQRLISGPKGAFANHLDSSGRSGAKADIDSLSGVAVYGVQSDNAEPRLVHEPGNPEADKNGFVSYPNIDQASQMTLMMKTSRAYEANIVMLNIAKQMYGKALELGAK